MFFQTKLNNPFLSLFLSEACGLIEVFDYSSLKEEQCRVDKVKCTIWFRFALLSLCGEKVLFCRDDIVI